MAARSKSSKSEVERYPAGGPVDPREEPSAEWGWHGSFPRAAQIAGWISAAALFLMLIGNHRGNVENLWLIGLGLLLVAALVHDLVRRRRPWRH